VWCVVVFFFFKQKTAYEVVDCDWSSDVCTSDLVHRKVSVPLRSLEFASGLLNISVLTATGTMLFAAFLRGV